MKAVAPKNIRYQILELLSDGCFHSGEYLGDELGLTRAAVWKQIRSLQSLGLEVHTVRGKGYRLARPIEMLNEETIRAHLNHHIKQSLSIDVFHEIESTNDYLLRQAAGADLGEVIAPYACLAELQTKGKGRQGKAWLTPFGSSLATSLLWRFKKPVSELSGLSLVVGMVLVDTLGALDVHNVQLKWPNDIVSDGRKLGGILIELSGDVSGPCDVVIGVGINMNIQTPQVDDMQQQINQPWTDLATLMYGRTLSRNVLAAALIENLVNVLPVFEKYGFAHFASTWEKYDALSNQSVKVLGGQVSASGVEPFGIASGVNELGNLIIKTDQQELAVVSGEVSIRPQ